MERTVCRKAAAAWTVYFTLKVLGLIFLAMWIRYTVPRFRYDQLMRFGLEVLLPASIVQRDHFRQR